MKMKNFKRRYLTISLDFVRFCEGTFRLEEAIYTNLNEIFDGQEQQSDSGICLNQEIQYTFSS